MRVSISISTNVETFGGRNRAAGYDGVTIINEAGSRIYNSSTAVGFVSAAGMSDALINHGVGRVVDGETAYFDNSQKRLPWQLSTS